MRRRFATAIAALSLSLPAFAEPPVAPPEPEPQPTTSDEPKKTDDGAEPEPAPAEEKPAPAEEKPAPVKDDAEEEGGDEDVFGGSDDDADSGWADEAPEPTFPRIEHHGYLRFRADMFGNLHLGTTFNTGTQTFGTSSFKPPLTENNINNDSPTFGAAVGEAENDETFLASANLRFRYQPTFLISESLKIGATFDVLDNLVMGSTPDYDPSRPDTPLAAFSGGQAPPSGDFQFQDAIRVKELYGEWKILGAIPLRFGRMKSDWGLGLLANSGDGWDDDYGDYNDRVMLALQYWGIYFFGGYDIVSSGPTYKQDHQPFGQAYDLTETDDVTQGFFGVFQRPISQAEIDARSERLNKLRKPAFDWGVYSVFRRQKLDLETSTYTSVQDGTATYDGMELIERDAFAFIPDVWLKLEYRPKATQRLRVELEGSMIYATIDNVTGGDPKSKARDVLSWGVALESEFQMGGLTVQLFGGAASGDSAEFLAVNDRSNFEQDSGSNTHITNFRFDRNYHIDQILFREVIGTVTNAWYLRPAVSYDIFADSPDEALGGELAFVFAGALEKDAYPGNSSYLGSEMDLRLFYEQTNKFVADLAFGLLIPGAAFDLLPGFNGYSGDKRSPEVAWTLQTHLVLQF